MNMRCIFCVLIVLAAYSYAGDWLKRNVIPFPECHDGRCGGTR